ncbi:MAG: DUF1214 domain-containing protein [Paracoccaceae bacterium]|nr:DUF1214 domain-containing protein [Paracoccaceae bacterium]
MKRPLLAFVLMLATAVSAQEVKMPVNIDSFIRAETDTYLRQRESIGAFGTIAHNREPVDVDKQPVVRANRDTLYSYGVLDLTTPATITMPEADRFQSIRIINQDHYIVQDVAKPGVYELSQDTVGSRYVHVNVRTLVNPADPEDVKAAHALQDKVVLEQANPGSLDLPNWDTAQLAAIRKAVLGMAPFVPDSRMMFGTKEEVDAVRHLLGTAGGWGGGPEYAVLFVNVTPEENDGRTPYSLTVKDVPVDGFWSISMYNSSGFFEKNPNAGYSLNNLTAQRSDDGSFTINFGGDPSQDNWLFTPEGWNYTIRMYLPRQEVIDGTWAFPNPEIAK